MTPLHRFASALLVLLLPFALTAQQESPYKLKPVYTPPLQRPAVEVSRAALPAKATGALPAFDGDAFHLNLAAEPRAATQEDARRALDAFLNAVGYRGSADDIRFVRTIRSGETNKDVLEKSIKEGQDQTRRKITGEFGRSNKAIDEGLRESADQLRKQAQVDEVFVFEQRFKGTPIENAGARAVAQRGAGLSSLSGRIFSTVNTTNAQRLDADGAMRAAREYISKSAKLENIGNAMLVLLPYGEGFRYAWKMDASVEDGPYQIWIDAENGSVLQLEPLFHYQHAGRGLVFNPNPNVGTVEKSFEVDAPSGNQYRLRLNNVLDVNNNGADGVSTGDVTISSVNVTEANFNVNPINGTVVARTNQANYNSRFQEVNVYAWVFTTRKTYLDLGSQNFPFITATVNHNNPCGFGINNACASGTNSLTFGIGGATTSTSTACAQLFNSAIDATVVLHEFGHLLNRIQVNAAGGTMTQSINEGMADFWACTFNNTDTFGAFWNNNCPAPVQTSFVPRQAEPQDIFPEHIINFGDGFPHSDGQIICWALWNSRTELNAIDALGTFSINLNLVRALATSGVGVVAGSTHQRVHDAYVNLLQNLVSRYSTSRYAHKILTGFARAGIFLSDRDAIVDINDDYLNRNDVNGPTFTVWTGRDYTFNANGSANTANQPFNTRFTVEVANDEAFTVNLISSGTLGGVVAADGGRATWTMPQANWNTLKAQNQIFYRVRTTDNAGGNVRTSGNPGNGFLTNVPAAKAFINESGECECACSASAQTSSKGVALVTLIPLVGAILWRRAVKRAA